MRKTFLAALIAAPCVALAQAPRIEAEAGAASLLAAAKSDFERTRPGVRVENALTNSAAGALAKLCRGEIGAAGAARAATGAERSECAYHKVQFIELPVATDSLALVVNPANTWTKQLSLAELRKIWLDAPGKATSWKQVNGAWPETPLKLYGPGPKVGLAGHVRAALKADAQGPAPELRADFAATEVLAIVVEGVARDRAALGLLDRATYAAHAKRVRLVPVEGAPSFPIVLYVSAKALEDKTTAQFLSHLLANGSRLAAQAGLAPLAAAEYAQARQRLHGTSK